MVLLLLKRARTDQRCRRAVAEWCADKQTYYSALRGPDVSILRAHAPARTRNQKDRPLAPERPSCVEDHGCVAEDSAVREQAAIRSLPPSIGRCRVQSGNEHHDCASI